MAAERLSMRTIKEVLRLKWEKKLSNKQIAKVATLPAAPSGTTWNVPNAPV